MKIHLIACVVISLTSAVFAKTETKFLPLEKEAEVVLFDAAEHDMHMIKNYTASWKKGSDLKPVVKPVMKNEEQFLEFTYEGKQGSAMSTFWYQKIPKPNKGMRYGGIQFIIDYDKDDFAKINIKASFSDKTSLGAPLTLEPGCKDYMFHRGFRRAKTPVKWDLLSYFWLSANADGQGNPLKFRLKRVVLYQEPCSKDSLDDSNGPDLFGRRLLNPRVKHIRWLENEFPARQHSRLYLHGNASKRTHKTADLFVEKYYSHTGVRSKILKAKKSLPEDGIVIRVSESTAFNGKRVKSHKEGYCLSVETNRVLITGFDEPGLYYGMVTFFQLMKNSMKIREHMPVPCVEIFDWPDLPNRFVSSQGTGAFRNQKPKDDFGIEYMMDWTDRFVAGQKGNILFWDLSTRVRYKRRPEFNGSERVYSLEDIRRFGEFCRDRFVEICPAWQVGGHANWWLLGYHPELREKGYSNQSDVTHPEHNKIVFDCMLDVAEALQCRYLSPKSDEWWGPRKAGETPDPLLHGKTRAEAYLDFHVQLNNWLEARGIKMLMYHDMLTPYHNGKKFELYRIAARFPKDIIIQYWGGYDVEKGVRFLAEAGFPIWIHSTGPFLRVEGEQKKYIAGAGKILYSLGNDKTGGLLDEYSDFNNMYASFRMLDYAWNFHGYQSVKAGRGVKLRNIMAVRPNPLASEKVEPINIKGQLNQSFNGFLKKVKPEDYSQIEKPVKIKSGIYDIGFIPMRLEEDDSGNCVVLRKGSGEVSILVKDSCSSLIFLHTAFINDPKDPGAKGGRVRYWIYGWPCGEYVVHYEDGDKMVLPLRLTMNIRRFDTETRNRATNENRYVHVLKDANQKNLHLFQWEWVNPKPHKKIEKIVVRHDNELDVSLILMAVSGRKVWKQARGVRSKHSTK